MKQKMYLIVALFLIGAIVVVFYLITADRQTAAKEQDQYTVFQGTTTVAPDNGTKTQSHTANPQTTTGTTVVSIITPNPSAVPSASAVPTATPTPAPTATSSALRVGSTGEKVRYVQQRLKELGYLDGSADGDFGAKTEAALKAFQKANGLTADGVVGDRTMEKLESSSAKSASRSDTASATSMPKLKEYTASEATDYRYLELGSSGSDVKKLQNRLIELGYLGGSASGKYDQETMEAVIAFQERNGQWVDGVAGQDTQSMLFSSKALAAKKN